MNAIFYLVGLSILIVGGEAQPDLLCHKCFKLWEEVDMADVTTIVNGTIFEDIKKCANEPLGVLCDAGEVCGKYEIALTSKDVEAVGTISSCVDAPAAAAEFKCSDESDTYRALHRLMDLVLPVNPVNPVTRCRMYLCYDDLCNTGHTAHISLLVAILISLYQLF